MSTQAGSIYDQGANDPDPAGEPETEPAVDEGDGTAPEPSVEPEPEAAEGAGTRDYVILVSTDDEETWSVFKTVNASSKEAARRSLTEQELLDGAHYREVPARSWGEATQAKVEKITNISFS